MKTFYLALATIALFFITTAYAMEPCEEVWRASITSTGESKLGYDLDRLAFAVATMETENCTTGTGLSSNNAFGIMEWSTGVRRPKKYVSCEESYFDFKRLWRTKYVRFPDLELARIYTGNDDPEDWLAGVIATYNSPGPRL